MAFNHVVDNTAMKTKKLKHNVRIYFYIETKTYTQPCNE